MKKPIEPRMIMGLQAVREAIRARASELHELWIQPGGDKKLDGLMRFAEGRGVKVVAKSGSELDRQTKGGRHQGVLAWAPPLALRSLRDVVVTDGTVVVALDGIMDPQNFGAVIRSAIGFGANAIIWPEHSSAPLSAATFRASAGAIEHATLCRVESLPDALLSLGRRGVKTIALDGNATQELSGLDLTGPVAIVIGAEDKGVRKPVREVCDSVAKLPMVGPVQSFNASVAGAIALYEVVRQRQLKSGQLVTPIDHTELQEDLS